MPRGRLYVIALVVLIAILAVVPPASCRRSHPSLGLPCSTFALSRSDRSVRSLNFEIGLENVHFVELLDDGNSVVGADAEGLEGFDQVLELGVP